MRIPRRRFLEGTAAAAALTALPRIARAQAYPSRPITMSIWPATRSWVASATPR